MFLLGHAHVKESVGNRIGKRSGHEAKVAGQKEDAGSRLARSAQGRKCTSHEDEKEGFGLVGRGEVNLPHQRCCIAGHSSACNARESAFHVETPLPKVVRAMTALGALFPGSLSRRAPALVIVPVHFNGIQPNFRSAPPVHQVHDIPGVTERLLAVQIDDSVRSRACGARKT